MMIRLGLLHQRFAYLQQEISFVNIYFIIIIVIIILSAHRLQGMPTAEMDPRVFVMLVIILRSLTCCEEFR